MRKLVLILTAICCVGVANANPYDTPDYRSSDYAATAYYRIDLGATTGAPRHVLGLSMANERAGQAGAPSLLRAEWTPSLQLSSLALSGLELRQMNLIAGVDEVSDSTPVLTEVEDPTCTGAGLPRADCSRLGFKEVVRDVGWFRSMFGDLSLAQLLTVAATAGIVVIGAYAAASDDGSNNSGASP